MADWQDITIVWSDATRTDILLPDNKGATLQPIQIESLRDGFTLDLSGYRLRVSGGKLQAVSLEHST